MPQDACCDWPFFEGVGPAGLGLVSVQGRQVASIAPAYGAVYAYVIGYKLPDGRVFADLPDHSQYSQCLVTGLSGQAFGRPLNGYYSSTRHFEEMGWRVPRVGWVKVQTDCITYSKTPEGRAAQDANFVGHRLALPNWRPFDSPK